jgi:hypothetical protein
MPHHAVILPHTANISPRSQYCPMQPILPHAADILHTHRATI